MAGNNPNNIAERGANPDGSFQGGDASKAIDATILTAQDIQALVDEIADVVLEAGIALDFSNTQQLKLAILQIYADNTANLKESDIFETDANDKLVTKEAQAKEFAGFKNFRSGGGFLGTGNPQRLTNADNLNELVVQGFYSVEEGIANNPELENSVTYSEEKAGIIKNQASGNGYITKVSETEFTGSTDIIFATQSQTYSFNLKRVDITRSYDKPSCLVFTNFPSPHLDKESDVAVIFQLFISKLNSSAKNYSRKLVIQNSQGVDIYEEAFTFDSDSAEVYEANITAFRIGVLTLPTDWTDDIDRVEELENNVVSPLWTPWSSLGEGSSNVVSGSTPITKSIQLFPTNPSNDNLVAEDVLERELWGIKNFLPMAAGRYGKITNPTNLDIAWHPGVYKYTGGVINQPAEVDANEVCLVRVHATRDDGTAKSGYSIIQSLFVFYSAGGNDLRKYERTGYLIPHTDWIFSAQNLLDGYTVVFSNWSKDLNKKEDITGYLITQMVGVGDTAFILSGTDILSYTGNPAKLPNGDANGASVEVSFKSAQLDLSGKLGYSDSIIVRRHDWTIASTQHRLFHTTSEHSSSYTDALLPADVDILAKYQKQASGLWQRTS